VATSPTETRRWVNGATPAGLHQDVLLVAVPNTFTRNQLEGRFRSGIEGLLADFFRRPVQLALVVDESLRSTEEQTAHPTDLRDFAENGHAEHRDETSFGRGDFGDRAPGREFRSDDLDRDRPLGGSEPSGPQNTDLRSRHMFGDPESSSSRDARLNPKYSFETFVIGSSNRFAHAAAIAVAENPGKSYNPLTIYGE